MSLKVTVLVPGRIGRRRKVIGYVELGGDVDSMCAVRHWSEMLAHPQRHTASWHQLIELVKE